MKDICTNDQFSVTVVNMIIDPKKLKIEDMGFFKIMENIGNNPILR